jgi:hypothetical protein
MAEPRGRRAPPDATGPQRRCLVSGIVKGKDGLLRFVVGPHGEVVADVKGRLPGRGIWLSADRETLKKACARNLFAKAARRRVTVPGDLVEQVEQLLVRRCQELVGLARRAGQAVFGCERARDWLTTGRGALLLLAMDGGAHARAGRIARATGIPIVAALSGSELGAVAGCGRSVQVVVAPGRLADAIRRETERLAGFRGTANGAGRGSQ